MYIFPFKSLQTLQEQLEIKSRYGFEFSGDLEKIPVGLTEKFKVYSEGDKSLYFYPGKKEQNQPLLLIYSLINRPYIFDLAPGRSMIEYLCNQGYDVYLIDWGSAGTDAAFTTLEEMIKGTVNRCVRWILRKHALKKLDILGYCMGSTFAVLYAGLRPELVNKLVLLTPPLGNDQGILQGIAARMNWADKISAAGIIDGRTLKMFFNSVRPAGAMKKERDFWLNYDQEKFMEHFLPVEKWSNDTPDIPGQVFLEFLDLCFKKDALKKQKVKTGNTEIYLADITCPVFSVSAQHDWIIPASALETVKHVLPSAEHHSYLIPGGHIGLVVGRTAKDTWKNIDSFLQISNR